MKSERFIGWVSAVLLAAAVAGCGGGVTGTSSGARAVEKAQACLNCHEASASPGTGKPVVAEWKSSIHFRSNVAGCVDCHEPAAQHPCSSCHGGMVSVEVVKNPDAAQKCFKCHGLSHPEDRMIAKSPQHFGNLTSAAPSRSTNRDRAQYLSGQYVGNCRKCHNPHDPTSAFGYNRVWAQSRMANINARARTAVDFKMFGTTIPASLAYNTSPPAGAGSFSNTFNGVTFTPTCVRCHTTTGYIKYVNSGFSDLTPFGNISGSYTDRTKEVTNCDACHDDGNGTAYAFKLRKVPAVRAFYNISGNNGVKINSIPVFITEDGTPTGRDAGFSNMCVVCHAGRGRGENIRLAANAGLNFANTAAISAHVDSGAATVFKVTGYEFSGKDYSNNPVYKHDEIGMTTGGGTPLGPCITCHMNAVDAPDSHTFLPVRLAETPDPNVKISNFFFAISERTSRTCQQCHTPNWTATTLQAKSDGYVTALTALFEWLVNAQVVTITAAGRNATPYTFSRTSNWEKFGPGSGPDTMGAFFNFDLLRFEPGGFAHNDKYVKRLIYDSIEFISRSRTGNATLTVFDAINQISATIAPAFFSQTQANRAIAWLYGKDLPNLTDAQIAASLSAMTAADKAKRPGD